MTEYLQKLSGFLFYLLGTSFFLAYLLFYNQFGDAWAWWLKIADLPLALTGVIYGGTSLYLSVRPREHGSKPLAFIIAIPLTLLFLMLLGMNFWEVI